MIGHKRPWETNCVDCRLEWRAGRDIKLVTVDVKLVGVAVKSAVVPWELV